MNVPWARRLGSDVILALSALLPWSASLFYGLVVRPIRYVNPSLFDAYEEIAPAWGTVSSLPISIMLGLIAGSFAAWRVSRARTWRWDGPYTIWRTLKWALALFVMSYALAGITPSLLAIRLGKIVPTWYERADDQFFLRWSYSALVCVLVGLAMFCIDSVMQRRFDRLKYP